MIFLSRPEYGTLCEIVADREKASFSYREVGATFSGDPVPKGYASNRYRRSLGRGDGVFERSSAAVALLRMYDSPMTELFSSHRGDPESAPDKVVAVIVRHFHIWSVNPVREVYRGYRAAGTDYLFSLAVGTLPGHEERGEERFTIRRAKGGEVWYELFSFTKPSRLLLRCAFPLVYRTLKRFDLESARAIAAALRDGRRAPCSVI